MNARPVVSLIALSLIAGHAAAQSRPVAQGDGSVRTVNESLAGTPGDSSSGSRLDRIQDGTANTILVGDNATVSTSATLSGAVNQFSNGGTQDFAVGTVDVSGGSAGVVETRADAAGSVSQSQSGGNARASQSASVGSVSGSVGTSTRTDATLAGDLTQTQSGGGSGSSPTQRFEVGSARNVRGSVETSSLVTGAVNQSLAGSGLFTQDIQVGSVADATASRIRTDALSAGTLTQSAGSGNFGFQRIGIASAHDVRSARSLDLHGQSLASIEQIRDADVSNSFSTQSVQVGSAELLSGSVDGTTRATLGGGVVQRISGASLGASQQIGVASLSGELSGTVEANGTVSRTITQENVGSGTGGTQIVGVGSVRNSVGATIRTSATLDGPVQQHISGSASSGRQIFDLGTVSGARAASVTTDAVMEGGVSQVLSGSSDRAQQRLSIASIESAQGSTLEARAHVSGNVSQILLGAPAGNVARIQEVSLGDISGSGTHLSTDVVVTGAILQSDGTVGGGAASHQRVAVGSIRGL